jgi:RNA polymerase-associated protein CTR9
MALTYCGKGLVHMAKMSHSKNKMSLSRTTEAWSEELNKAGTNFENAVQCDRGCIPAILGKAAVQFNRKQYADALKSYKQVLQLNPACPPEVRLGLAHCHAQLKQTDKAALSFRRVLQLAPENVEAMAGLAILEMNAQPDPGLSRQDKEAFTQKQVESGIKLLERAYTCTRNCGQQHAVVLNHLANHFVFVNELDKASQLAHHAFNNTEVRKIRAESCYHIARTLHIKGDYEQAHKYYEYATQHSPEYLLPQYGLAQTKVHLNKLPEALACLDKVLKANPNSYEVRKLMGCVAQRSGDKDKAMQHLSFILEVFPEDTIDEEVHSSRALSLPPSLPPSAALSSALASVSLGVDVHG